MTADADVVIDTRLGISVAAAIGGLSAGAVAAATSSPVWGVVAGCAAVVAGIASAALAVRGRAADERAGEAEEEIQRLRRELDSLAAIFAEEAIRRSALEELGTEITSGGDDRSLDPATGLLEGRVFPVLVHYRLAAARRGLRPMSIVFFELDGFDDAGTEESDQALGALAAVLLRSLRECDACCRVGHATAAAVLDDTAEAGAVWAAERVRANLLSSPVGRDLTISAGIACYPSHAFDADELVQRSQAALVVARSRGHDHVEIARSE